MKRGLLFIVFLLCAQFSFGQVQSNCTDNAALIAEAYKYDIHYLTERSIPYAHPDFTIDIPKYRTEAVTQALTAIFNTGKKLKADSVFDNYCVHEKYANIKSIEIMPDTNATWIDNWINGNTETGNDTLDNLLKRYGYTLKNSNYFILESEQLINRFALCDSIEKISGIKRATPSGLIRFGITTESIYYSKNDGEQEILFVKPWREGSYNQHRWTYTISNNCMVSLEDTVFHLNTEPRESYPALINCNISASIKKQDLKIYPNPITSQAIISTAEDGIIELYSLSGQRLKRYISDKGYTQIDIGDLANGIYIIQEVTVNGKTEYTKIVKQ